MLRLIIVIALVGSGTVAPLCAQTRAELEALQAELSKAELDLEWKKRILPLASAEAAVELGQFVRKRAEAAGLKVVDVKPVAESETVLLKDSQASPIELYRVDISGRGSYGDVYLFLEFLLKPGTRLLNFDTFRLTAASEDEIIFKVRLAQASWAPRDDPTPAMSPGRGDVLQQRTAAIRQRLLRTRSILDTLNDLTERYKPERFVGALAAFSHGIGDHALALTEIRGNGDIVFEGMLLGSAARKALLTSLDQAGFQITGKAIPTGTDCLPFSMNLRLKSGEPTAQPNSLRDVFDARASECRAQTSTNLGRVEARGSSGPLTVRLRDVDVVDVFNVLHDLTAEDFVIAPDAQGRVSVQADGATLDQILTAMASANIVVGPGPLRLVRSSKSTAVVPVAQTYQGEPVSFLIKNADLSDVLCIFKEITGLSILMPGSLHSRVSIFADEVRWDQFLDAIIGASSLAYQLDGNRLLIGRPSDDPKKSVDVCQVRTPSLRWKVRQERIGASDLTLAGLARVGEAWRGYAYTPGPARLLLTLSPDSKFVDARVKSVTAEGVALQTENRGVLTLPLGK